MPKVLISDDLSPRAVEIFAERGVDTDVMTGLSPDELKKIIGKYDGLAMRSATKVTKAVLEHADEPEGDRPRRHRRRQCRRAGGDPARHRGDEHALRQFHHHRRACHRADVRAGPPDPGGRPLDPGGQMGEVALHGGRAHRQGAGGHRLRQYRLDRRRPRHRPQDEGGGLRSLPLGRARRGAGGREGRARRTAGARRFHHAAHAADRCHAQHHRRQGAGARPRRACASSTARAAGWWSRRISRRRSIPAMSPARRSTSSRSSRPRRARSSAATTWSATPHLGAATSEAQENVALQVAEQMSRLSCDRRGDERAQHAVALGRGGGAAQALYRAGRAARQFRRPAHHLRAAGDRDRL